MEFHDGILRLYRNPVVLPNRWIFPSHLTTNPEHKEAAIAFNQCTTAVGLLGPMARKLLSGIPAVIDVLSLKVGKRRVPTIVIPPLDDGNPPHVVLRVNLPSTGENWIIDTTGGQYGFREVLLPYHRYISDNECMMVCPPSPCPMTETESLDLISNIPFLISNKEQQVDQMLERQAHILFAAFVKASVDKDILKGSTAVVKDSTERFASG
ncbi:uncharacterized protein DNG_09189 [Cephalotrichum gorgonifer]|uniref:Uncharacterized protein n=1 Tax=Cephalotrichum gorgonifer TaxID=2041049 RepID=A0AAE8N6U3_9PEZI|nr:uncharacterized protein DNG_09189 [Cephalotrichum gorgonifer]